MDSAGYLIFIIAYVLAEVKFDEAIRVYVDDEIVEGKLMHSPWQLVGRGILILAIIWCQAADMEPDAVWLLLTLALYVFWYWVVFDSIFAASILHKPPWYLGTTSKLDKRFGEKLQLPLWIVKWLLALAILYLNIKFY